MKKLMLTLSTATGALLVAAPAYAQNNGAGAAGAIVGIVYLAVVILMIASMWKIFTKAGKPGWAAIVPIYNIIVLLEIVDKPIWWIVLFFIPIVSLIASLLIFIALAAKFGKGTGFAIGMVLLAPVFFPMLAFGDAQYQG